MERISGYQTKQRDLILSYFATRPGAFITAKELIRDTDVGEATVYRTLAKCVREGILKKIIKHDSEGTYYQYNFTPEHSCFQLHCTDCGKNIRLDCGFAQDMERHIRAEHAFSVDCSKTVIYGLCELCGGCHEKN